MMHSLECFAHELIVTEPCSEAGLCVAWSGLCVEEDREIRLSNDIEFAVAIAVTGARWVRMRRFPAIMALGGTFCGMMGVVMKGSVWELISPALTPDDW